MTIAKSSLLILVNTGTPKSPSVADVQAYLEEFLSDPKVVDCPRWWWLPLLRWVILPRRRRASSERYRKIWTKSGSPLLVHAGALAEKLQVKLGPTWCVRYAMRYGEPNIEEVLKDLNARAFDRVFVMPMYAQYATQTTDCVWEALDAALKKVPLKDEPVRIESWYEATGYIKALARSVERSGFGAKTHLVMSFHGVPVKGSETYRKEVEATARALSQCLGLREGDYTLAYQSKFGSQKWLNPNTVTVLENLAAKGLDDVAVVCPGFSMDCLETLEEVAIEMKETFLRAGGKRFTYIPALNDQEEVVAFYSDYVRDYDGKDKK